MDPLNLAIFAAPENICIFIIKKKYMYIYIYYSKIYICIYILVIFAAPENIYIYNMYEYFIYNFIYFMYKICVNIFIYSIHFCCPGKYICKFILQKKIYVYIFQSFFYPRKIYVFIYYKKYIYCSHFFSPG